MSPTAFAEGACESQMKSDPLKVLYKALNGNILVKLKDGREFAGKLVRTDDTMNMILVEASEVANGGGTQVANYGKLLVRGNNILYVRTDFNRY